MILFLHLSSENGMVQNQQENLVVNLLIKSEQKKGPAYKLTKHNEFLITLMKIPFGLLNRT